MSVVLTPALLHQHESIGVCELTTVVLIKLQIISENGIAFHLSTMIGCYRRFGCGSSYNAC